MSAPHVIFRADASTTIGTGHFVRCRTLADALVARGWRATVAVRTVPTDLADEAAESGLGILRLATGSPVESEQAEIARELGDGVAVIVGDMYGLDAAWFTGMRQRSPEAVLMAIDDLADRPLPVDLLLNQNLGATAADYGGLVPAAARILIGPAYALLRPAYAVLRERRRVRDGRVEQLLVFMSGADEPDVTARAAVAVANLGLPADVIVGVAYPHLARLRSLVARQPTIELHVNTTEMADLMYRADLAVGAASSASWERCALGLPAVLVTLADNQVEVERRLQAAGAAYSLGWHEAIHAADIESALRALMADPATVVSMSQAAAALTDGHGTERVVAEIEALTIRDGRWDD